MKSLRLLLLPFSFLYGLLIRTRNYFFDVGVFKSAKFKVPVICVGNLSTGGTGKTPHVEFLAEVLSMQFNVAVLSRGYKRKTTGFYEVNNNSSVFEVGDEPLQIKQKFNNVNVFVCEDRKTGIEKILKQNAKTQFVILDDAFQHRSVVAGINILLTPFDSLYADDFLLPAGNLREPRSGAKRAQVIIVTKCPAILPSQQKAEIEKKLLVQSNQHLFFSSLEYSSLKTLFGNGEIELRDLKNKTVLLVSAIASPPMLINFLQSHSHSVEHLKFPDHHFYSDNDLQLVKRKFDNIATPDKIIVCTEKDAVKLRDERSFSVLEKLPAYFLPVKVKFENSDSEKIKRLIEEYVGKN